MTALTSPASFTGGGGGGGGAFDVPLDSYSSFGGGANSALVAVNTSAVTAMPSGGTGPYTYAWALTDANEGWSALSPSSAMTQFRRTAVEAGTTETATFECTVTDALGAVAVSDPCEASATNYGDIGGFFP